MSSLSDAIATFSSCDKEGSIPQFTEYLRTNPNDYTALLIRARALRITGEYAKAKADFERAASVTGPPRKYLARAESELLPGNKNPNQGIATLSSVVKDYPNCAEAWSNLGFVKFYRNEPDVAFEHLNKAVNLGKSNGETSEVWYPWSNTHLGDICYADGRIELSSMYYKEAIRTCSSLTIAHLGSSRCDIMQNNTAKAKASFEKAKTLNSKLVDWASFDEFRADVVARSKGRAQTSVAVQRSEDSRSSGKGETSGGGNNGSDNNSSGGESDSDEDRARKEIKVRGEIDATTSQHISEVVKMVKKEAPEIKEYNGKKYYKSKDEKYWYVRDTAGHAGALFKKYKDRKSSLEFVGSSSIDKYGNLVDINPEKKHESKKIPVIEKSKMKNCK